ncbi:MAG TPA: sulfite exporter TauE/SafE family protein [Amaricoccus sp.]|nr:sulfite exporter TauE/SafE family protein [Amaricoccus sp.]
MPGLEGFIALHGVAGLVGAAAAVALGGFAKGVVGFALPLIALSLLGSFLPYDAAVALLIVPMLVSNLFQALRQGIGPALGSLRQFWRLNLVLMAMILVSAQLVVALPDRLLFGIIGTAVTFFAGSQLAGWRPRFDLRHRGRVEVGVALVSGFFGGLSGIWGPPLVMYLIAVNLPKTEMVRTQSLSFLLGSAVLFLAHLHSGVLDPVTLPASAWMTVPTMLAMFLGYQVHDRLDQRRFTTLTLVVLVLSGLNLLRRAIF